MYLQVSVWYLTPFFQHNFSYIAAASAPIHAFLEIVMPVLHEIFFQNLRLLSPIIIVETMDISDRRMNPVAKTI